MVSFDYGSSAGPADDNDIVSFQQRTGITLPAEYISFLLKYNGGKPTPSSIKVSDDSGSTTLAYLYGIFPVRGSLDLEWELDNYEAKDELPDGWLIIGHDPGGNLFLMSTTGEDCGHIYYHDGTYLFETTDVDGNTYPVASSINDFLDRLY